MEYVYVLNEQSYRDEIVTFLANNHLNYQQGIDSGVLIQQDNQIIGCGFIANHLLCCIAIDMNYRHQGLLAKLMTLLLQQGITLNRDPLYLMTKKSNQSAFCHNGLYTIIEDEISLMSNDKNFLSKKNIDYLLNEAWIWPNYFCTNKEEYETYKLKMKKQLMEVENGNY